MSFSRELALVGNELALVGTVLPTMPMLLAADLIALPLHRG
ncbi:MAG: hypothetical protein AAFR58_21560 [Cyanobacteria bacterium J06627_28]